MTAAPLMSTTERDLSISHVLFDFDGTLANSLPSVTESYRHACRSILGREFPLTDEDHRRVRTSRLVDLCREIGGDRHAAVLAAFRERYLGDDLEEQVTLYDGVHALLDGLVERTVGVGIVTNKTRMGLDCDLRRLGIDGMPFTTIVSAEDSIERKPHPRPLLIGLERAGCCPADAVYVGDGPHDIVAATAARMRGVGAAYGDFGERALRDAGAYAVIQQPEELLRIIDGSRPDQRVARP